MSLIPSHVQAAHSYAGRALSTHEQIAFENAAQQTHIDEKLAQVPAFWGKIEGVERDYVIAVHMAMSFGQIRKQFYVYNPTLASLDKLQPPTDAAIVAAVSRLREPFAGDLTKQYSVPAEAGAKPAADGEEAPAAAEPTALSELDRLAAVVAKIDFECALIPRGALYLTAAKNIAPNAHYAGVTGATALRLDSYQHYRDSVHESVHARLANALYHFTGDFLDSIAADAPKGVWSVRLEDGGAIAQVRSNLWPGYVFDHAVDGTQFAGAYIGNGVRQDDVAFML